MMIFKSPIALLFSLAIGMSASAAPVVLSSLSERDVWVPPILTPNSGTVWKIGSCYNVTWDTSNPPAQVTNPIGTILLGHVNADGSGGENLNISYPLAQGFSLYTGWATITAPEVQPNNNYIVALIGDSGNISPQFTITA